MSGITFNNLILMEPSEAVIPAYARNFAQVSAPRPAILDVVAHGGARLNGQVLLRGRAIVPVFANRPVAQHYSSTAVEAVIPAYARGSARLNGEVRTASGAVLEIFASTARAASTYGTAQLAPLGATGADRPYNHGGGLLSSLQAVGNSDSEFEEAYALGVGSLAFLQGYSEGIVGDLGEAEAVFQPLNGYGADRPYATGVVQLLPLDGVGYEQVYHWTEAELDQPFSVLEASGTVTALEATLDQPLSELDGRSGWPEALLMQPASQVDWEATNPAIMRGTITQPRSFIEGTGLVGRVGRGTLTQPRGRINGRGAWSVLLTQPGSRIEAVGLSGRVGQAVLTQPVSQLQASGTVSFVGQALLTQPFSDLVPVLQWELVQPRSALTGGGFDVDLEAVQQAYAVNALTTAVTRYPEYHFADVIRANNEYLAVGPEGIFRIEEFTGDDGEDITSLIEFGQRELAGSLLSRAIFVYYYVESKEPFSGIFTNSEGYRRAFRLAQRDGTELHTRRVKGPRGVMARSWGAALETTGQEHFRLVDIEIIGEAGRRKI